MCYYLMRHFDTKPTLHERETLSAWGVTAYKKVVPTAASAAEIVVLPPAI